MSKKLELNEENVLTAYQSASTEQKSLLEALFGKELFKPKDITERVKTFVDACEVLGDQHPYVQQWAATEAAFRGDEKTEDFLAYLKLRIIVAALNEGWEPQFTEDEYRYFPWFYLYTKEEYDKMDEEEKGRCVLRSGNITYSSNGLVNVYAFYDASNSYSVYGSRLAFKNRNLAEYAARQFAEILADFVFKPKAENNEAQD